MFFVPADGRFIRLGQVHLHALNTVSGFTKLGGANGPAGFGFGRESRTYFAARFQVSASA